MKFGRADEDADLIRLNSLFGPEITTTRLRNPSECRHVLCHKFVIYAKDRQIIGFSVAPNISTKMVDNPVENIGPAGSQ